MRVLQRFVYYSSLDGYPNIRFLTVVCNNTHRKSITQLNRQIQPSINRNELVLDAIVMCSFHLEIGRSPCLLLFEKSVISSVQNRLISIQEEMDLNLFMI